MGESLCHKTHFGDLVYKATGEGAGRLVYKAKYGNVVFSWGDDDYDLDVCGYWIGYQDGKVGYGWTRKASSDDGVYALVWYGDDVGVSGSEKLLPKIHPWNHATANHTLRVHVNWYGNGSGTCRVKVKSSGGTEVIERDGIVCGVRHGNPADVQDPYVDIVFDNHGNAVSITQGGV